MRSFFFGLLALSLPLFAEVDVTEANRQLFLKELPRLDSPQWEFPQLPTGDGKGFVNPVGPALERYRDMLRSWASWTDVGVTHVAGYLPVTGHSGTQYLLGVNLYLPAGPLKGTLFFVHGYLGSSYVFSYTLARQAARGYAEVTLDLPGHNLSTGPMADIADFADYGSAVTALLNWAATQPLPRPWVLTGHSLGASSVLESQRIPGAPRPDRVVLAAPLLHTDWYPAAVLGYYLLGWAIGQLPPVFGSDGFLSPSRMPVTWMGPFTRWNSSLENSPPLSLPYRVDIISGDHDQVVDEGWNMAFLKHWLPGATQHWLKGGDHMVMTNHATREAFNDLFETLEDSD